MLHPITSALALVAATAIVFGPVRRLVPATRRDRVATIMLCYALFGWLIGALLFAAIAVPIDALFSGVPVPAALGLLFKAAVLTPLFGNVFFVAFAMLGVPAALVAGILHAGTVARNGTLGVSGAVVIGSLASAVGLVAVGGLPRALDGSAGVAAWFASGILATLAMRWGDARRSRSRPEHGG